MGVPTVSFVIPTLNRGRYVLRAVASCLATQTTDVAIEVIVLDSMSDDGSWEALNERFHSDPRVILKQNKRGLGPTRSWLDGAKLVTGEFVTFLWSDDYVSPQFLETLLPALQGGCDLATGDGSVRDIDDDSSLPAGADVMQKLDGDTFLLRHMGIVAGRQLPVSPAVALFTRAIFERWIAAIEDWCTRPGVRHDIMWKRAIGPDLMLFLGAGTSPGQRVAVSDRIVAQFSSHAGSITVSSSKWPLRVGYWLAKWWATETALAIPRPSGYAALARLVVQGLLLHRLAQYRNIAGVNSALVRSFGDEVASARELLFASRGSVRGRVMLAMSASRLTVRLGLRFVR